MNSALKILKLVHAAAGDSAPDIRVGVGFGATQSEFVIQFEVESSVPAFVNPELPRTESAWELWNWDVVEVYIEDVSQKSKRYFEFQVSPLGQFLELEILEPRKNVNRNYRSAIQARVSRTSEGNWNATFRIPWTALGASLDALAARVDAKPLQVRGNAFAILGPETQRTYWSLFTPLQKKPDFHIPNYFQVLFVASRER